MSPVFVDLLSGDCKHYEDRQTPGKKRGRNFYFQKYQRFGNDRHSLCHPSGRNRLSHRLSHHDFNDCRLLLVLDGRVTTTTPFLLPFALPSFLPRLHFPVPALPEVREAKNLRGAALCFSQPDHPSARPPYQGQGQGFHVLHSLSFKHMGRCSSLLPPVDCSSFHAHAPRGFWKAAVDHGCRICPPTSPLGGPVHANHFFAPLVFCHLSKPVESPLLPGLPKFSGSPCNFSFLLVQPFLQHDPARKIEHQNKSAYLSRSPMYRGLYYWFKRYGHM